MKQLPRSEVRVLWDTHFWDGVLAGICMWNEDVYRFNIAEDSDPLADKPRVFDLFELSDTEFRDAITQHLLFEQYVGSHCCRHIVHKDVAPHDGHHKFYDKYPPNSRDYGDQQPIAQFSE